MFLSALLIGTSLLPWALTAAPTYSDSIFSPYIAQKYGRVGSKYRSAQYPHTTAANGTWTWKDADWWTSGFLPASFYLLNERKNLCPKNKNLSSVNWLTLGRHWSDSLVPLQSGNGQGHDQGFLSLPYMEELRVNPTNTSAVQGVQNFAKLLAARYSSVVGCTRSWNSAAPDFLVIMDNMMNLELLFKAADITANRTLIDIAIKHADTTIKNHIRPDGSSYHVVDYNQDTGAVIKRYTAQGYADNRDFDAPTSNRPADTSAAMITAEGLFILSAAETHVGNSTGATYYREKAVKLMTDNFKFAFKPTWDSILSNGTSNSPQNNKNTGLIYGDYYALQAGNTMLKLGLASC
ncbi:hypothetical protein FRC10_001297 [Ceratobasidium sp. 414]|nr:hypothetical protein FRC10_001297 [Ceratobasidium sp. 414]